jgi:nicotinate-nucleotide adenylyltransferase
MRLGIFGGTFDPVHFGHLLLAESAREQLRLDEVWFMPAATPPHKRDRELTSAKQRVEMLELAIAGNEAFRVSTLELDRGGVSYTVDTLRHLLRDRPDAELFLLMGADSLRDLVTWREPEEVCRLALPAVVRRGGEPDPDFSVLNEVVASERLKAIRASEVEISAVDFNSTDLRERAAEGRSLRYRTPRAVEKYIETQQLYRA